MTIGMIPAAELADMQAVAASALDTTVAILRNPTKGQSGKYGQQKTPADDGWDIAVASVACSFATPSANTLGQIAERLAQLEVWQVSFPVGTDCQVEDRVDDGTHRYVVHARLDPQTYSTLDQFVVARVV